ncbi:MAG: hypothetical protein RLZ98_2137 [Pseudomonadota bacterium]|jgi:hypothetical protein
MAGRNKYDLEFRVLESLSEAGRAAWKPLFENMVQGYDYYRACELAQPDVFRFFAAGVFDGDELIAGTPMFSVTFRLDMLMDGSLEPVGKWLHKKVPRFANVPVVGAGSPHSDDLSLVFSSRLDDSRRAEALEALLVGLHRHASDTGARVVFVKSVADSIDRWANRHFAKLGYSRIASLPIARLELPSSPEAYIASLSANMRSNLRRKLKKARNIRVDVLDTITGLEGEINSLRDQTRLRSRADYDVFEELSPNYFSQVMKRMGGRARMLTYWDGERLIGFALALIEQDRIIEKYTGLRYPDAIDNGVFFLNWMELVKLGIEQGVRELHAGETTYLTKVRLGCKLERSWIYIRHRLDFMNPVLKAITPLLAFDKTDPDLKLLGGTAPYL